MTPEGRALSKPRGDGFAAEGWLENDGDRADQAGAHARADFGDGPVRSLQVGGMTLLHATGKAASAEALTRCREADVVIVNVAARQPVGCEVYDAGRLAQTGALAIEKGPEGPRVVTARQVTGARLWSQ